MNTVLVLSLKSNCVEASFFCIEVSFPPDMAPAEGWAWKPGKDGYQDQALLRPSIAIGGEGQCLTHSKIFCWI